MRMVIILSSLIVAGCSASSGSNSMSNPDKTDSHGLATVCDMQCQTDLAQAVGSTFVPGPDGQGFQYDSSTCSLWNQEPDAVRLMLTEVITAKLGGTDSSYSFTSSFDKAITTACASYTTDSVKSVATTISNTAQFPR